MSTQSSIIHDIMQVPVSPAAAFDDTPSRHPCKISVLREVSSEKRRFQYNPYKGLRAPALSKNSSSEEDDDDMTLSDPIAAALAEMSLQLNKDAAKVNVPPPPPVQSSTFTAAAPKSPAPIFADVPAGTVSPMSEVVRSTGGAHLIADGNCFRMAPGTMAFVNVRFKFAEDVFFVPLSERYSLSVGDLVVVEGDRGENVGTVIADVTSLYAGRSIDGQVLPSLLRRALNKDRKNHFAARRKEGYALATAQNSVSEYNLQMVVLDCEFQTDLQKLTIYYRPLVLGVLVDFRQLQRAMFKHFRCRVWLRNWDTDFQAILEQHQVLGQTSFPRW